MRVGGCADVCHVGGLTDNVHVLCFRCLRKKPLSRDLILIHMQFNRSCKNKIKGNYVIYQTIMGVKKEKEKIPDGTSMAYL